MLSKANRLTRSLFQTVMDKGVPFHSPTAVLKVLKTDKNNRFSVVVSKKVSKSAVERNKIRRRVYSAIRNLLKDIKIPTEGIFIIKEGIKRLSYEEVNESIRTLFVKSSVIK